MYPYGLIGNCQTAALVSEMGSIDWLCFPRPDSEPIFGRLLDAEGGHFSIGGAGNYKGQQLYLPNAAVLTTTITCEDGSQFKITDFSPRFHQHGRMYRPAAVFRMVEPTKGNPTLRVSCKPVEGWSKKPVKAIRGNSHLRWKIQDDNLRLVTNMPLTYLCDETPFLLKEKIYFGLTWSYGFEEELPSVAEQFLKQTIDYWDGWVKHCSIPSLYQKETIRSALTLKLHCYEDTGAILAALTTSLPEENGGGRNWDYRFCWLRDAYFALSAFYNLGHYEEMEGFITFLLNIAEKHDHSRERLRPVYRLDQSLPLPEIEQPHWDGYMESRPVRCNNQAAEHVQNDVYGEMILTLAPIFFDERFHHLRTKDHERLLAHLGKFCIQNISKPDAGLWELRNGWQEHSFSNLMCWAGIDRLEKIREMGFLKDYELGLSKAKELAKSALLAAVKEGSLRNGPKDDSMDAALLQISTLRFNEGDLVPRTVNRIWSELKLAGENAAPDVASALASGLSPAASSSDLSSASSFLYRYKRNDDFGNPKSAFLICSFWLVQALAKIGQMDGLGNAEPNGGVNFAQVGSGLSGGNAYLENARSVMKRAMTAANHLGLFSEHYLPSERRQAGNFPQAYSHVGQINAAFAISPPWGDVL